MATEAEQARAAVFRRPQTCIPLGAAQKNVRNARQRLGIIDDRRPAPESHDRREGRTDTWNAALAFERLHQRRLFANLVSPRAAVPENVKIVSAAEDVLAEKAFGIGIAQRLLHDDREIPVLAANIDVSRVRPYRERGDHDTFDDGMRVMLENQTVFAGAGLALIAVA